MNLRLILLVAAFILFALAAFNVGSPRFNLIAAGLALFIASILFTGCAVPKQWEDQHPGWTEKLPCER